MVIEFYTPEGLVKEWIISYARDAVMKLHKQYQEISRAEISFRQRMKEIHSEKICEIKLFIFSDTILTSGSGNSFDHAVRKAVAEVNKMMASKFKTSNEPPDEVISTVKV